MTTLTLSPMNDEVITYPTVPLSSLSTDAITLMSHMGDIQPRLKSDPFVVHNRGYWKRQDEPLVISDRLQSAIDELVVGSLATWNPERASLNVSRVHPLYTIAQGRGTQIAKVHLYENYATTLLAIVIGCDLTSPDNGKGLRLRARHANATDFEHDSASVFDLKMDFVQPPEFFDYGQLRLAGVLTELRMYPFGVDPLTQDDGDTEGDPTRLCNDEHCEPHPFAPYSPPEVEAFRTTTVLKIDLYPMRPYTVAQPPAFQVAAD